jgi:hypothetical protein
MRGREHDYTKRTMTHHCQDIGKTDLNSIFTYEGHWKTGNSKGKVPLHFPPF